MTTYFTFTPSKRNPFQFQPELDGDTYSCQVLWNLYGQRYYLYCRDAADTLIFTVPLIESPPALDVQSASWSSASLRTTLTTKLSHGYLLGQTVGLVVADFAPASYNGAYDFLATSQQTLDCVSVSDPGSVVRCGNVSQVRSLSAGYFASLIVCRNGQFEVSP